MEYRKVIELKDGRTCVLRHGTAADAEAVLDVFVRTHGETDYLTSYPDEIAFTLEREAAYLKSKAEDPGELELLAEVDGRIVGTAGIDRVGKYDKVKHRASFGISIAREYWGLGVGRAMVRACVECAESLGYLQLELDAAAENARALALYESEGFVEYGRNPKGFRSRLTGWQELVLMRRELRGESGGEA